MVLRRGKGGFGLQETPASHLHLSAHPFARGWSGSIVHGTYEGHRVAVKLAPFGSGRAQALFTEIMVYYKLKKYWGKHVPMLVSHGTTADRKVVYIATQLIYGHALGIERLTPEVVRATFDALNVVHASGILHRDIRRDNILVVKGGQGGVRLIDFGFSRPITSTEDCKKECAQLLDIIQHFSPSLHWSPSILGEICSGHLIETV